MSRMALRLPHDAVEGWSSIPLRVRRGRGSGQSAFYVQETARADNTSDLRVLIQRVLVFTPRPDKGFVEQVNALTTDRCGAGAMDTRSLTFPRHDKAGTWESRAFGCGEAALEPVGESVFHGAKKQSAMRMRENHPVTRFVVGRRAAPKHCGPTSALPWIVPVQVEYRASSAPNDIFRAGTAVLRRRPRLSS